MRKRRTNDEYIEECRIVHNNKYDYSKTKFTNMASKIIVTCPIHGDFEQRADSHIQGKGCSKCKNNSLKKLVYRVGINDLESYRRTKLYEVWKNILTRCYSTKFHEEFPTYINCEICEEWKTLSKFKEWFDKNYIEGYELDKDILVKGNKVYSPDTCCFVPPRINYLLLTCKGKRGTLPRGVKKTPKGKFQVRFSKDSEEYYVGTFNTVEEAFNAYKQEKESYIKELAKEYFFKDLISDKIYEALMNYSVEIED